MFKIKQSRFNTRSTHKLVIHFCVLFVLARLQRQQEFDLFVEIEKFPGGSQKVILSSPHLIFHVC